MTESQAVVPSLAEGEGRREVPRAAPLQGGVGLSEEGLGEGEDGVRTHRRLVVDAAGGQEADRADAHGLQQADHLVLDHIRKGADDQQFARLGIRQDRDHGGENRRPRLP